MTAGAFHQDAGVNYPELEDKAERSPRAFQRHTRTLALGNSA